MLQALLLSCTSKDRNKRSVEDLRPRTTIPRRSSRRTADTKRTSISRETDINTGTNTGNDTGTNTGTNTITIDSRRTDIARDNRLPDGSVPIIRSYNPVRRQAT